MDVQTPINTDEKNIQFEEPEKELLVNINCPLRLILNYIRDVIGLSDTIEFDLCDEINCQLRKVSFFEPHTSGLEVFQADVTYLVVMYQRDINGQIVHFVPLITGKAAKRCSDIILKTHVSHRKSSSVKSASKKKTTNENRTAQL